MAGNLIQVGNPLTPMCPACGSKWILFKGKYSEGKDFEQALFEASDWEALWAVCLECGWDEKEEYIKEMSSTSLQG